ncbi:MAG TPA: ABC transporter permease [Casimicrobiaceae bacterium]|nr:ABC transporter permease [Casimicrobiaceae bacterium]
MLWAISAAVLVYLLAPIIVVVATAFTATAYPVFPPRGFSLHWFEKFLATPEFVQAIRISTMLAASSTILATSLGTFSGLALARFPIPGKSTISALLLSPILFPTIVLGLALLIFNTRIGINGTFPGLVCAHVVLVTPFVIRMVMVSLSQFDPAIEEAARNVGAGWWRTFLFITLPLIRPGVVAGAVFAFILSFDELVVTLFLSAPGLQTLPIRIYTYVEYSSDPTISAISTVLIATWLVIGLPVYARFFSVRHP